MILVVDDEVEILELTTNTLRNAGYTVKSAQNRDAALELIDSSGDFELAVVDFWLEGQAAVNLFDDLQSRKPSIPFIMMSGGANGFPIASSDAVARISGAGEFIQKPFRREDLLTAVCKFLG